MIIYVYFIWCHVYYTTFKLSHLPLGHVKVTTSPAPVIGEAIRGRSEPRVWCAGFIGQSNTHGDREMATSALHKNDSRGSL